MHNPAHLQTRGQKQTTVKIPQKYTSCVTQNQTSQEANARSFQSYIHSIQVKHPHRLCFSFSYAIRPRSVKRYPISHPTPINIWQDSRHEIAHLSNFYFDGNTRQKLIKYCWRWWPQRNRAQIMVLTKNAEQSTHGIIWCDMYSSHQHSSWLAGQLCRRLYP